MSLKVFRVLLWKMAVVRKRLFLQTLIELLTPTSLIISLFCLKEAMMESSAKDTSHEKLFLPRSENNSEIVMKSTNQAYANYVNILSVVLGYASFLGPLLPFIFLMIRLLEERLSGITELIKMNGADPCLLVCAHFINAQPTAILFSCITILLVSITSKPMLPNSNSLLIFICFFMHYQTIFALAFISSYMGQSTTYDVSLSLLVYISLWVPTRLLGQRSTELWGRILRGFLPHAPHYWFLSELRAAEVSGDGLSWSNINTNLFTFPDGTLNGTVLMSLLMQLTQIFLFLLMAWYVERVLPGKFGIAQPWNFFIKKEYWQRRTSIALSQRSSSMNLNPDYSRYFEEPPDWLEIGIRIVRVYKTFGSGKKMHRSLSNVNLDIYKGEITVLLGHNGAGKSTLINIITGMINPTSGRILVNGYDTAKQQSEVRQQVGYCPQHNLTFPDLTVREHFMFFSMLKGGSFRKAMVTAETLLKQCDLEGKANKKSHELSGGLLRRLQLGCALCGNAKILILDEPTSGLDVEARRELWDMLLALRSDRTVLLTTHFMEEADVLGDRVAALHQGRVRCHASPMYLKRAVGSGFRMSMTTKGTPDEEKVIQHLNAVAPGISLREKAGRNMVFDLPMEADLSKVFNKVEENRTDLDIDTLEIGVTTLEEVFIELCCDVETNKTVESEEDKIACTYIRGCRQILRQTKALLKRQLDYTYSKKFAFLLLQVLLPIILCCSLTEMFNWEDISNLGRRRNFQEYSVWYHGFFIPKSKINATMFAVFNIFVLMSTALNDVILPCRERVTLARHTHILASCAPALYWLVTFLYHIFFFVLIGCNAVVLSAYFFDFDDTINDPYTLISIYGALILCGMDFYVFMYFVSFFFAERGACLVLIACSVCLGFLSPLLSMALEDLAEDAYEPLYNIIMDYIGVLVPSYVITQTISRITQTARWNSFCRHNVHKCPQLYKFDTAFNDKKCCLEGSPKAGPFYSFEFTWHGAGVPIVFVILQFFFYSTMILLLEYGIFNWLWTVIWKRFGWKKHTHKTVMTPTTQEELEHVEKIMKLPGAECEDALQLHKVTKIYAKMGHTPVPALNEISFSMRKGECFGLLGPNGCGKTTTFKCITHEESITDGQIRLNGVTLHQNRTQYLCSMGYCPQFFGLDEFRSCRASVRMLLILRGLSDYDVRRIAEAWIDVVGLTEHAHRQVSRYSGGMVRRAAAAAALCGAGGAGGEARVTACAAGPACSLLDEPTAGVDTAARRLLWAAFRRGLLNHRAILISSHCMDEIEMLCNRVTILVEGNMVVLGTPAELKQQYATGHSLVLKLVAAVMMGENGVEKRAELKEAMKNTFLCTLKDEHVTSLHYRIRERLPYSEIFHKMTSFVSAWQGVVEDFTVAETSLEDVFLFVTSEHARSHAGALAPAANHVRITLPDT